MQTQIDTQAVANFVLDVCDYDAAYEDDAFVVDVAEGRFYVERKRNHFNLHIADEVLQLPRF